MIKKELKKKDSDELKGETGFDYKILELTLFIGLFGLIASSIGNFLMELNIYISLTTIVGTIVFLLLFFYYKINGADIVLKWLVTISTFVILDFVWFFNCGFRGPTLFIYLAFFTSLAFLWESKPLYIVLALILLHIIAFILIELYFPRLIDNYQSETSRFLDVNIGFGISIIIVFLYVLSAKKSLKKETLAAKESDELKTQFLINMSHEIRTPLSIISGYSEILAEEDLTIEEKKEYSRLLYNNSVYVSRLVDDIIDVSTIETNQFKVDIAEIIVYDYFEELRSDFYDELNLLSYSSIQLEFNYPASELVILTDKSRLNQIIRNLFSNAVKFTDKGVISFGCIEKKSEIVFYIKDTGRGIKEENIEKIFYRFVKIDDEKNVDRGTGIGLYLVKKMINQLYGKVWVESVYGEGSTFYFSIPRSNTKLDI